jgi:hypothetical protein
MSVNNSTFDAGFNIVTPDYNALDSRYYRQGAQLSESISSYPSRLQLSRNIFGSGSVYIPTDCVIYSSGSGARLRFNGTTGSVSGWSGSVVYDTNANKLFYANSTNWVTIIDSNGGTMGNLYISASSGNPTLSLTGSTGGQFYIANASTKLFEISSSAYSTVISSEKDLLFKTGSSILGSISMSGLLNFSSGSFVLGQNSNSNNKINGNLLITNTLSASAISCSGDIIAFSTSDERLKRHIVPLNNNLEKLDLINAYSFEWKPESGRRGVDVGILAQEIEKIIPEAVITRGNGYKAVDYEKLIPFLIGCIKELKQKVGE